MRANRSRDTLPERRLRSELHRIGLRFRKHFRPLRSVRCEADVAFPRQRVAVFLDGCFWHGCVDHRGIPRANHIFWSSKIAGNRARDARNEAYLANAGWTVLRIWEHEPLEAAAEQMLEALGRAGTSSTRA
jgi:DNA mismatch endonuclease (patch repair protein)